jgi:hypothetical protein
VLAAVLLPSPVAAVAAVAKASTFEEPASLVADLESPAMPCVSSETMSRTEEPLVRLGVPGAPSLDDAPPEAGAAVGLAVGGPDRAAARDCETSARATATASASELAPPSVLDLTLVDVSAAVAGATLMSEATSDWASI